MLIASLAGFGDAFRQYEVFGLVSAGLLLVTVPWTASWCLREYLTRKHTAVKEILETGKPRSDKRRIQGTAVVCGGSIGGLWAARICADHFEDVLIVDPEELDHTEDQGDGPGSPQALAAATQEPSRKRILQYSSAHIFQPINMMGLRHLFPHVDGHVASLGGLILPITGDIYTCYGKMYKISSSLSSALNVSGSPIISRHAYQTMLRQLVLDSSSRIRSLVGSVTALESDSIDPRTITSVKVRKSPNVDGMGDGEIVDIPAALVVDCTGMTQAGLKWVRRFHENASDMHTNKIRWDDVRISYDMVTRYVTYRFHIPEELWTNTTLSIPQSLDETGVIYAFIPQAKIETRYFVILRLEGHRIEIACGGWGNPPIPETKEKLLGYFSAFAPDTNLPTWIITLVEKLVQIERYTSEVNRTPRMSYVQYHKAPFLPRNFVAVGDAVMNLNPIFGQGCSKALIGAAVLDRVLRSTASDAFENADLSKKYFNLHKDKLQAVWDGTKAIDYGFSTTVPVNGETLASEAFNTELADLILELCAEDDKVDETLWYVRTFLAPTTDVLSPSILVKLGFLWLKRVWGVSKAAKLRKST